MALTRYGELRNQLMRQISPSRFAPAVLRDADSNYVPIPISERLVQAIWYDQRIRLGGGQIKPIHVIDAPLLERC